MELALSLGDSSKPFQFLDKTRKLSNNKRDLGGFYNGIHQQNTSTNNDGKRSRVSSSSSSDHDHNPSLLQLHLLPSSLPHSSAPLPFPWLFRNADVDGPLVSDHGLAADRSGGGLSAEKTEEGEGGLARSSSPKRATSSFRLDFGINMSSSGGKGGNETERASSRGSDDEENGLARKKLRLSKEQSAFLEESFKELSTPNPKQKLELAKQLNLRPRQVEVWFQNRRARTKLKQTEVDYECLKRCCETLTEENRRLQKEVQELRALKTSQPFFTHLPATTLTMCPACERVSSTSTTATATINPTTLSL